jgi:hypothetical protein
MIEDLINKKVIIYENDFIDENMFAKIISIDENNNKILLELNEPLLYKEKIYSKVVFGVRHTGRKIIDLESGMLGGNLTWISEDRYNPNAPFDVSWWRGGASAITSIKLL